MFVIIDVRPENDGYCAFGNTLEAACEVWKRDSDYAPELLNPKAVMIVEGVQKIAKVTYVNAPAKSSTSKQKKTAK